MALTVYYTGQLLHTLSTYRTRFTTLTVWSICGTIPRALCEAIGISDEDISTKRSHLTSYSSEGEDPMQLVSVERASQRSERHSRRQETIFYYQESLSARHIQESGHVNTCRRFYNYQFTVLGFIPDQSEDKICSDYNIPIIIYCIGNHRRRIFAHLLGIPIRISRRDLEL